MKGFTVERSEGKFGKKSVVQALPRLGNKLFQAHSKSSIRYDYSKLDA